MSLEAKVKQSMDNADSIIAYISKTTKEVVNEIRESGVYKQPFIFVIESDTYFKFEVFIKGTKTTGDDYTLHTWKTCPVVKGELHQNVISHPTQPNEFWVLFSSLGTSWGCDNETNLAYLEQGRFKKAIHSAVKDAIEDFTEQNTL